MREIREITQEELDDFMAIAANAYPGIDFFQPANREQYRARMVEMSQDPAVHNQALFEDNEMRGVMNWHDFTMNLFGKQVPVGGIAGVAVDLTHKKKKVAADMVRAFHQHYLDTGACLAALYPFSHYFYRRMGYGFGTVQYGYRIRPASLPKGPTKSDVVFLDKHDQALLEACYERQFEKTHGLMARAPGYWNRVLESPSLQFVGVKKDGALSGYLGFRFEKGANDQFLSNDIFVYEMIYETADDLSQLLTFLNSQADQIEQIIYNTHDDHFFYLLGDTHDGAGRLLPHIVSFDTSTQGAGMMYRVLHVPRLFEVLADQDFGGETCRLRLKLSDSFLPENSGGYTLNVVAGKAKLDPEAKPDVTLTMDIAEFSSLVVGAVNLRKLVEYGLATLSDNAYLGTLDRLFSGPKPVCLTQF